MTSILLLFGVCFLLGGIGGLAMPTSEMWWGPKHRPRPQWQMNGLNMWMYMDSNGREPSPAGIVAVRLLGCLFCVAGIVLLVKGIVAWQ